MLWEILIKEVIHNPHVDGGDDGEPDKEVGDMLSHQLVHAPLHQLLIDLGVVQHLWIILMHYKNTQLEAAPQRTQKL